MKSQRHQRTDQGVVYKVQIIASFNFIHGMGKSSYSKNLTDGNKIDAISLLLCILMIGEKKRRSGYGSQGIPRSQTAT
jgi:hypothetical protein